MAQAVSCIALAIVQSPSMAGRGLGAKPTQVNILAIQSIKPNGLKLAQGWIRYNDGDVLTGIFRIYCPTKMIRPTNYILKDRLGVVKREGLWWDPAFPAKWDVEQKLVNYTCKAIDFGVIHKQARILR